MTIPKIIHHIAPKKRKKWHPVWIECYDSWKRNFLEEEYEYFLWNDSDDIDSFIKNEYPQYWKIYKNLPSHMLKIDFARIAIIYKYGGIFSDLDIYCFENFYSDLIDKDCCLVKCRESDGHYNKEDEIIVNFFLAAKPKHTFFKDVLEKMVVNRLLYDKKSLKSIIPDRNKYGYHVIEHCIMLMSRVYKTYDKDLIQILPSHNYNGLYHIHHKGKKIQHMFTGVWGIDSIKSLEMERLDYIKETKNEISYHDFANLNFNKSNSVNISDFKKY